MDSVSTTRQQKSTFNHHRFRKMSEERNRVHWSFWLICTIAVIWNVIGSVNFLIQLNPEMIDAYRESERAIVLNRPVWATAGFALAVFGGAIGSLLLILRKTSSFYLLIVSLLGVIITIGDTLSRDITFGVGELIGIVLMPVVVAAFLLWYSKFVQKKFWVG